MAATRCPHNCSRCRAIEAGFAGQPFTPRMLAELFGVIEPERRNGHSAPTVEAEAAMETAEAAYDHAHQLVGELLVRKRRSDPELEDALTIAVDDRARAAKRLTDARVRYYELARADELRRGHEEYANGQAADASAEADRDRAQVRRTHGLPGRRGNRS